MFIEMTKTLFPFATDSDGWHGWPDTAVASMGALQAKMHRAAGDQSRRAVALNRALMTAQQNQLAQAGAAMRAQTDASLQSMQAAWTAGVDAVVASQQAFLDQLAPAHGETAAADGGAEDGAAAAPQDQYQGQTDGPPSAAEEPPAPTPA